MGCRDCDTKCVNQGKDRTGSCGGHTTKTIYPDHLERLIEIEILITKWGGTEGNHHKQWLLNEIIKVIKGNFYAQWVIDYNNGDDGPNTYEWDEGIAP